MSHLDQLITVGSQALRVRVEGPTRAPWLVFSNSLMTDLSLWDGQIASFGNEYRIVRYDTRGHGGSEVPTQDCDFNELIADWAGVLQQIGVAGATACGVSMGGLTALGLAARHPRLVSRVAICDCQPTSTAKGAAAWEERFALARTQGMAAVANITAARWLRPETVAMDGAAVTAVRRMAAATSIEGFIRVARAMQSYDLTPDLEVLAARRCPVAFVVGAEDAALPHAVSAMAQACPGSTLTLVPDCGHLPNLERQPAFDAVLANFLATPAQG